MSRTIIAACVASALVLCGCASDGFDRSQSDDRGGERRNIYPANYKSDLLAFLHTYLNDPTNVRDAFVSEPAMKSTGRGTRYVACVKFNARNSSGGYSGSKEYTATFVAGRFDQLTEALRDQCTQAAYLPFPELEKLTR